MQYTDVYRLLKIKRLVVWFCHALNVRCIPCSVIIFYMDLFQSYAFQVDKLFEVLLEIRCVFVCHIQCIYCVCSHECVYVYICTCVGACVLVGMCA